MKERSGGAEMNLQEKFETIRECRRYENGTIMFLVNLVELATTVIKEYIPGDETGFELIEKRSMEQQENKISHLSAVNEKQRVLIQGLSSSFRHCKHCSTCWDSCSDCIDCTAENYLKIADEMGE